ncbi:MAG: ribonuclease H-like domain-containing protein, partial [Vicinamibacteraceae bacterium]
MSTLDRLRALVRGTGPASTGPASTGLASTGPASTGLGSAGAGTARARELTYEPVGDDGLPLVDAPLSASLAGATEIDGPLGKALVVERHYAPADWHGSLQLRDARVTPDDVALIGRDPAAADAPRARILYLDLETTGLSGGAGTVAFLVGCALSREDGSFLIRQFVLPSFAAEKALIGAVSEWARAEAAVLVTYNG